MKTLRYGEVVENKGELGMKKTMKALVKKYRKPGLWLEDVPVPEFGINDVLIKVHKSSICGTDVHIWNWDAWAQKTIPVLFLWSLVTSS
jgi:D-arabinose 1-dehydrogenase-like Zn-dependent alcohol dehydrogenase